MNLSQKRAALIEHLTEMDEETLEMWLDGSNPDLADFINEGELAEEENEDEDLEDANEATLHAARNGDRFVCGFNELEEDDFDEDFEDEDDEEDFEDDFEEEEEGEPTPRKDWE